MNLSTDATEAESPMNVHDKARKYLFELSFDDEVSVPAHERDKQSFSNEELEATKKESYDSGFAAGKNAMLESQQQQMNLLLSAVESQLKTLHDNAQEHHTKGFSQLRKLALVIMRKIMPSYVKQHGFDEVQEIVSKTITEMNQEPRLVIRVNEDQFEDANKRINALADNQAYDGKLVLLGDPELAPSDCRIEWADGGIERDQESLWQEIDKIMGMPEGSDRKTCTLEDAQTLPKPEIKAETPVEPPKEEEITPPIPSPEETVTTPPETTQNLDPPQLDSPQGDKS